HHLGIRMTLETQRSLLADALQLSAQINKVINLAVEDNDIPAVRRYHRLVAGRSQIHYRQPAMAQRHAGRKIDPRAFAIGTAMRKGSGHALHAAERGRAQGSSRQEPCNSTHIEPISDRVSAIRAIVASHISVSRKQAP